MKSLHRISFDSNNGEWRNASPQDWYELGYDPQSASELAAMGDSLKDGVHVILYMSDLEVEAVLEFDMDSQRWAARPMWETKHDVLGDENSK